MFKIFTPPKVNQFNNNEMPRYTIGSNKPRQSLRSMIRKQNAKNEILNNQRVGKALRDKTLKAANELSREYLKHKIDNFNDAMRLLNIVDNVIAMLDENIEELKVAFGADVWTKYDEIADVMIRALYNKTTLDELNPIFESKHATLKGYYFEPINKFMKSKPYHESDLPLTTSGYFEGPAWFVWSLEPVKWEIRAVEKVKTYDDLRRVGKARGGATWHHALVGDKVVISDDFNLNDVDHVDLLRSRFKSREVFNVSDPDNPIYSNKLKNCVSTFARALKLDQSKYHDGMKLNEFLKQTQEDNITIKNNNFDIINGVYDGEHTAYCFNGHVMNPKTKIKEFKKSTKKQILEPERFVKLFNDSINDNDNVLVSRVKVYSGEFGVYLKSFEISGVKYMRDFKTPIEAVFEHLEEFKCSFCHPLVSNCAVYSGFASKCYGYDLNAAYIEAFKRIREIPIIDNIPIDYKLYQKMYKDRNDVALVESFKVGKIRFPTGFYYLNDIKRYNPIIRAVYLTKFKPFDGFNDIVQTLRDYKPPQPDQYMKYNDSNDDMDKWIKRMLRFALGTMINKPSDCQVFYTDHLEDITNEEMRPKSCIYKICDKFNYSSPLFLYNVYFAMSAEYHRQLFDIIDEYNPEAIYCDCFYVKEKIDIKPYFKFESFVDTRECSKSFKPYKAYVSSIQGMAGTGKTSLLQRTYDPFQCLVIVPEWRLSTVWEGYNVSTIAYIRASHEFPAVKTVLVDEMFKNDTEDLNDFIGLCMFYGVEKVIFAGDPFQLRQINITTYKQRIEFMIVSEFLTINHRNGADYEQLGVINQTDTNKLQQLYDQYLRKYTVDNDFNDIVYCWRTEGEDSTRSRHESMYAQHIKSFNDEDLIYARCIKSGKNKIGDDVYFNGIIYQLPKKFVMNHKSYFKPSNVYSVYATQGLTLSKLKLIAEDEKYYVNQWRCLYVLLSRLDNL